MRGRVTFLPLPMIIRKCSGVNPALCRDQKESREKVSLQHKDKKKKRRHDSFSRFSLTFYTHSHSLSHTPTHSCTRTLRHARPRIKLRNMQKKQAVRNISENNVILLHRKDVQNDMLSKMTSWWVA